ncbi:hypothetical protein WA026_011970 [Henosepilachna vigintioctopunctata]|uniref:Uncharacterized protein n=1 Tax=Henosepilachna vigintioctopunctata TaxID=420089 RepID=A0AAW1V7F6_9CUCU
MDPTLGGACKAIAAYINTLAISFAIGKTSLPGRETMLTSRGMLSSGRCSFRHLFQTFYTIGTHYESVALPLSIAEAYAECVTRPKRLILRKDDLGSVRFAYEVVRSIVSR